MPWDLAQAGLRQVFVRDLVLDASIGVYDHEQRRRQRIRLNLELGVVDEGEAERADGVERLDAVVDYQRVAASARSLVAAGHVVLAETLAERIAARLLALDPRIRVARVRVEKLEVFADAASAGVAIERRRPEYCPPRPSDPIDSQ